MKQEIDETKSVNEIYTTLSEAKEEIWRRWNDDELKKRVEEYLGKIPKQFKNEPRAVLSRNIISPNFEFHYFFDLVRSTGLKPIGLEGIEDKFCTKNKDKVSLGKLTFFKNNHFGCELEEKQSVKIIDLNNSDGKRFCDIDTFFGCGMVNFHHKMLELYNFDLETFDDFKWFKKQGKKNSAYQYYENFFAFFICHGILFENFHANGKEKEFTDNIVLKNYEKVGQIFGLKPLIVPIVPIVDERCSDLWNSYPKM